MSALQRIASPVLRATSRRSMSSYIETFEKPSYDVLPQPKGSWQEDYNRRNAKANTVLAIGLVVGGATLAHALYDTNKPVVRADLPTDPRAPI